MTLSKKIEHLHAWGKSILANQNELEHLMHQAKVANQWFTIQNSKLSINAIAEKFLNVEKLNQWLSHYKINDKIDRRVGIISAGNLPLVGFHDVLCAFVLGLPTQIKLSSKDEVLMKYFIHQLQMIDNEWEVEIVERLKDFDAVIATGSNNTNRYFEYYFKEVPSLLRKSRSSVALLTGDETAENLKLLADDIFQYFGMGCRSVGTLLLPKNYNVIQLFEAFEQYSFLADHKLYKDNFDYNCTLLLMNQIKHLASEWLILKEDRSLHPRLATVHYIFYNSEEEIEKILQEKKDEIQCIVGQKVPFGKAQQPELWDYADGIDIIKFLIS